MEIHVCVDPNPHGMRELKQHYCYLLQVLANTCFALQIYFLVEEQMLGRLIALENIEAAMV